MKWLLKLLMVVLFIGLVASCKTNDEILLNKKSELNSKQSVEKLNLDSEFNISKDVYNEFIESLIFENGKIVGAIYDGIEKELDDVSSNNFWENFDISIRNKEGYQSKSRTADAITANHPVIFEGYKPKRGGCKANSRWICVI